MSNQPLPENHFEIISYQKLRTFIGIIGIFLPIACVIGSYIKGAGDYSWQPSISHYYYSKMHIIFVGTLCVLGGFLITYKGKPEDKWESRVSNLAGYCAFGVASFPTAFKGFIPEHDGINQYIIFTKEVSGFWSNIHFGFAGILFGCFILFCLKYFQKPDHEYTTPEEIKKFNRRKRIYKICGWGIAVSIALLFVFSQLDIFTYSTFTFETTSLFFFGTAWLIKGSAIWSKAPVLKKVVKTLR